MSVMQSAMELAEEHGMPVFPCRPDKKPYTEHGFKDASKNLDQIEAWWKKWPTALIGVPTGKASGIIVIDIDPDGADWYRKNAQRLACGRVHKTPRGWHLLYRATDSPIGNSASKLAAGVDVRGDGGYIIWWPAHAVA